MNIKKTICYIILLSTCTSCQWRCSSALSQKQVRTVSVPYAQGDGDGTLTNELITSIEKTGNFKYVRSGGELVLHVHVLDKRHENIGYRYCPKKLAEENESKIIPNESRAKILAEVTVTENATGKTLLGPAYILATHEYDHQNYSINNNINSFSLGQLSDIDTAEGVLPIPRNQSLAHEIVEYLENHFDSFEG